MLEHSSLAAPLLEDTEERPAEPLVAAESTLRWSRDSFDDNANRAAVKFKASIFYWQLLIHLFQPFSLPLLLICKGWSTAVNMSFLSKKSCFDFKLLVSYAGPVIVWAVNAMLLSGAVRTHTVFVVQVVLMNCFFAIRCYLIAAKYSLMTRADYTALMDCDDPQTEKLRTEVTLMGGWAVPTRIHVTDEFRRSLRRIRTQCSFKRQLSICAEQRDSVHKRLNAVNVGCELVPGEALVVSVEQMFVMVQQEVLIGAGCYPKCGISSEDNSPYKSSPFLKRWVRLSALVGVTMAVVDIPLFMIHGGWPEGRLLVACWICAKVPLCFHTVMLCLFTAVGSLDYQRRYKAVDAIRSLIQPTTEWRRGQQRRVDAAVVLDTVDNATAWYSLLRVTRDCGKLHYVKIQMLFSACFVVVVLCTLAMLVQVLDIHSAKLDPLFRNYVCITCGLAIAVVFLQLLQCVSWGHKANKIAPRMRQAILEQHMHQLNAASPTAGEEAQGDVGDDPKAATNSIRCEFDILEILQNKILVDDLDHPIKLLGLRADSSLVRIVWTVCASLVAIFSYFVKL